MYTISEIASAMNAELSGRKDFQGKFRLLIDSRTLTDPETSIFFAFSTAYNNGNHFIPELYHKGVGIFVTEEAFDAQIYPGASFLKVKNVLKALQDLAVHHRGKFKLPVIGITGSNGKTIVKEWLVQTLSSSYHICASPKSYNSQIGVPLSLWQLDNTHQLGIFEAGISSSGEMQKLKEVISPSIGILTHLGSAHNTGFSSEMEKLNEKLRLFENCRMVLMAYNPEIASKLKCDSLSYGEQEGADLRILTVKKDENSSSIFALYKNNEISFRIPFRDEASIENACLTFLCNLYLNTFDEDKFMELSPVQMRMELKKGIQNCILINDSYSNDLSALNTAISFLKQQALHKKLTLITSDIEESGLDPEMLYKRISIILSEQGISRLIAIGPAYGKFRDFFGNLESASFFNSTSEFLEEFYKFGFADESILIKGARRYGFETIVRKLELVTHGTVLEINLNAVLHNLGFYRNSLPKGMKIMAMVKAFAYGSGTYELAKLLQNKVDYLAVAYTDEGIALRKSGIHTPVMVLNANEEDMESMIDYNLEPVIYGLDQLRKMLLAIHTPMRVHIELDTGMHRLGFMEGETAELCELLNSHSQFEIASVFSHLAASDEKIHDEFTKNQFQRFHHLAELIETRTGKQFMKHISNTAASLRFDQKGLNMIRLGIGLYGIDSSGEYNAQLETVFTLKTHITQIKKIGANESIGYSRKAVSENERTIAILALGYADGLNRILSNGKGHFMIRGKKVAVTGNICMDMCMVDTTGLDCLPGDEAIFFGREQSILEVAEKMQTIPYELLTSISQRVKRVYVNE